MTREHRQFTICNETDYKFVIVCMSCGANSQDSNGPDIGPRSDNGYWDDGYVIQCEACGAISVNNLVGLE